MADKKHLNVSPANLCSHALSGSLNQAQDLYLEDRANLLDMLILVTDDGIGQKDTALSKVLMKNYFKALAGKTPYPKAIVFINKGVLLTLSDSQILDDLRVMEAKGVLVLANCTCLDYYKAMDQLAVGGITNMYNLVEIMKSVRNTVSL